MNKELAVKIINWKKDNCSCGMIPHKSECPNNIPELRGWEPSDNNINEAFNVVMSGAVQGRRSTILKNTCTYCTAYGKYDQERSHLDAGEFRIITFECGHTITQKKVAKSDYSGMKSEIHGYVPYKFQEEGASFADESNIRCLIADEMGLGKTIQALMILKKHPELFPVLILCKASLKVQWFSQIIEWLGLEHAAQIIDNGKQKPIPGFSCYIVSVDSLRKFDPEDYAACNAIIIDECQTIKNPTAARSKAVRQFCAGIGRVKPRELNSTIDRKRIQTIAEDLMRYHQVDSRFVLNFENIGGRRLGQTECRAPKTVNDHVTGRITINLDHAMHDNENEIIDTIMHEIAHAITPGAGHSLIWRQTAEAIGASPNATANCSGSIEFTETQYKPVHIIALSGTPIKNNASEYFTILNILRPELFPRHESYINTWCDVYSAGAGYKVGGIKRHKIEEWNRVTGEFIIRRTRDQVLSHLPKIRRNFEFHDLGDEVEARYKREFEKFVEEYEDGAGDSFQRYSNLLAFMSRMRHIVGYALVEPVFDYAVDFLNDTERKLTIFVHHKDVADELVTKLNEYSAANNFPKVLSFHSGLNAYQRDAMITEFKEKSRIMVTSTQAGGEGINLQFCYDAVMMERQWNPANEEQAECRFPRPGIDPSVESIAVLYPTVTGTINEYFMEIVEKKRGIVSSTMDGQWTNFDESSAMKELADTLYQKGKRRWKLK